MTRPWKPRSGRDWHAPFLAALEALGSVRAAINALNISNGVVYQHYKMDAAFAAAWDHILDTRRAKHCAELLAHMAQGRMVEEACEKVGISPPTAYRYRATDPVFAAAWAQILAAGGRVTKRSQRSPTPRLSPTLDYNERHPIPPEAWPEARVFAVRLPEQQAFRCAQCDSDVFAPSVRQPKICIRCAEAQKKKAS